MTCSQEQSVDDRLRSIVERVMHFKATHTNDELVNLITALNGKIPKSRTKRNLAIVLVEAKDEDQLGDDGNASPVDYDRLTEMLNEAKVKEKGQRPVHKRVEASTVHGKGKVKADNSVSMGKGKDVADNGSL
jgi:hypothetical protein